MADTPTQHGDHIALLEKRLRDASGGTVDFAPAKGAISPALLAAILAAVQLLIQNCTAQTPRALRRRLGNRARVALALYRDCAGLSWAEALGYADRLFDLAESATDEEIRGLVADCCS